VELLSNLAFAVEGPAHDPGADPTVRAALQRKLTLAQVPRPPPPSPPHPLPPPAAGIPRAA
jgi:hypothetical protein